MTRLSQHAFQAIIAGHPAPRRAHVAGLSAPLAKIPGHPRSLVGATTGDVVALNAQVDALNASFGAIPAPTTQAQIDLVLAWPQFLVEWKPWQEEHKSDFFANDATQAEFVVFTDRFNQLRDKFASVFPSVPTQAKPFAPSGPPSDFFSKITGTLGTVGIVVAALAAGFIAVEAFKAYEASHPKKA